MHKAACTVITALVTAAVPAVAAEQPRNLDYGQMAKTFSREVRPLGAVANEAKAIILDPDNSSIKACAQGILFTVTSVSDALDEDRKRMVEIADLNTPTAIGVFASILAQTLPLSQHFLTESTHTLAAYGKQCISRKIDTLVTDATSAFAAASGALDHVSVSLKDVSASSTPSTSR